jgi:hypothetical protein
VGLCLSLRVGQDREFSLQVECLVSTLVFPFWFRTYILILVLALIDRLIRYKYYSEPCL